MATKADKFEKALYTGVQVVIKGLCCSSFMVS